MGNQTLAVQDSANGLNAETSVTVVAVTVTSPVSISTSSLIGWDQNLAGYNQIVTAAGGTGAVAFSLQASDSLPAGLSLNSSTGAITGTPTTVGTYTFQIVATDSAGDSTSQSYTVTIAAARIDLNRYVGELGPKSRRLQSDREGRWWNRTLNV